MRRARWMRHPRRRPSGLDSRCGERLHREDLVMSMATKATPTAVSLLQSSALKSKEFDQIRELAYQYCGLNIHSGKEELVAAVGCTGPTAVAMWQ